MNPRPVDRHGPDLYEIRLQGRLDERWATWFDGMTLTTAPTATGEPVTLLSGHVADQAALHGLLARLRDVGVPLISVTRVTAGTLPETHTSAGEGTGGPVAT